MKYLFLFLISSVMISCSSSKKNDNSIDPPSMSDAEYDHLIKDFTKNSENHDGLQNLYNMKVTFLNTKVQSAIIDRLRYNKQYNVKKSQRLREKAYQQMSSETQFFISYYSPKKSLRHLDKGDALWKIYLVHNGIKHEAQIDKYNKVKYETQNIFPFHSRWSKAYLLRFKVPTSAVENSDVKLIITSSAGKAVFNYPQVN